MKTTRTAASLPKPNSSYFIGNIKSESDRLETYGLRLAMPSGPMLERKATCLIGHSFSVGDKGNMPLQKGYADGARKGRISSAFL
jgi:hypothetical protein